MNHTSPTKRLALSLCTGPLIVFALAGCQSGGQSDLVTRELRIQEDQIYAMEDYLAQYQQLLCQVRRENAALRRQIVELEGGDRLPEPAPRNDSATGRRRAPTRSRLIESPSRAPIETDQESDEMKIEIIEPNVPPLDTTSIDQDTMNAPQRRPRSGSPPEVIPTETVVRGQSPDTSIHVPPKFVQIRGEVVANDSGGGPRLAIVVMPLSATLEPVRSFGAVSLMLLEPNAEGQPNSLARWDYSAADAAAMSDKTSRPGTLQFRLELPVDVPTDRKTELWVRLMPEGSDKVLGHVPVDLRRPGLFGETSVGSRQHQQWSIRQDTEASYAAEVQSSSVITPVCAAEHLAAPCDEAEGWTIARPDRPADLALEGGWRTASRPIPVAVASVPTPTQLSPTVQQAAFVEAAKSLPVATVTQPTPVQVARTAPVWTPERGGVASNIVNPSSTDRAGSKAPARHVWSPER